MKPRWLLLGVLAAGLLALGGGAAEASGRAAGRIRVASKPFTESYILSEMVAQLIDDAGEATAERRFGLGGPNLVVEALRSGEVDVDVNYTGSLLHLFLKERSTATLEELRAELLALRATGARVGALERAPASAPDGPCEQLPAEPAGYAEGLYAALHRLDDAGCAWILIAEPPEGPAWAAIRDRLRRAARRALPERRPLHDDGLPRRVGEPHRERHAGHRAVREPPHEEEAAEHLGVVPHARQA